MAINRIKEVTVTLLNGTKKTFKGEGHLYTYGTVVANKPPLKREELSVIEISLVTEKTEFPSAVKEEEPHA